MITIINDFENDTDETTELESGCVKKAAQRAIEAIKNELPEEAQTVEAIEYVISEINRLVKERRMIL